MKFLCFRPCYRPADGYACSECNRSSPWLSVAYGNCETDYDLCQRCLNTKVGLARSKHRDSIESDAGSIAARDNVSARKVLVILRACRWRLVLVPAFFSSSPPRLYLPPLSFAF